MSGINITILSTFILEKSYGTIKPVLIDIIDRPEYCDVYIH